MKVTFLSTFEKDGGAAAASYRIYESLKKNSNIAIDYVFQFKSPFFKYHPGNIPALVRIGYEKFYLKRLLVNKEDLFAFESGIIGKNILNFPSIRDADILHLHWISQGFISLKLLAELAGKKKIVWTLHDMWPITGGCTYAGECNHFIKKCGNCPMLKSGQANDLSRKIWKQKLQILSQDNTILVGPSSWMTNQIKNSSLGKEMEVTTIPYPIDPLLFNPADSGFIRKQLQLPGKGNKVILFGAQNLDDKRKGFDLLVSAIAHIQESEPAIFENTVLALFGNLKNKEYLKGIKMDTRYFGPVAEKEVLIQLYQAADVYIHGAIEDNLPNMIIEALSCGTPVIGFNTGGIPDMIINNTNGKLIDKKDPKHLAAGIIDYFNESDKWPEYIENARNTILTKFSPEVIAEKYLKIYQKLL